MHFFIAISTAIALSLDAFSLSLIYGSIISRNKIIPLSVIVGIFHFFMPILGFSLGHLLFTKFIPSTNLISFMIFMVLGIEMLFSKNNDENVLNMSKVYNLLLFAFTVSIDSFSIGVALALNNQKILIDIITFSLTSFLFTLVGLFLGQKIGTLLGKYTNKIGGLILIMLSLYYLFT